MLIGYARISTHEQNPDLQVEALRAAGCNRVFTDEAPAAGKGPPPGLARALEALEAGDTLVVWRLDRLERSLQELMRRVEAVQARQAGLRSLHERIDTTGADGTGHCHVFSTLAAFERDLVRARTQAGLRAARARGRLGGRPKRMTPEKVEMAARLMKDAETPVREICAALGVSKSTLYRHVGPDGSVRTP